MYWEQSMRKALASFILVFFIPMIFSTTTFASGSDDLSKLIEGAKKEGSLMLYASGTAGQSQLLIDRFKEKYPFMKVGYYRAGKVGLLTRISAEHRSKKYTADVLQTSAIQANILKKGGILEKYLPPESKSIPEEYRDPEGYWHGIFISEIVLGYNKDLVSLKEVPKTYDDLLQPKWKGNIEIETNKVEWFATLLKYKGESFLQKLAQQKPSVRAGDPLSRQLLAAREFSILADTYLYAVEENKLVGMPIDWIGLEPVPIYFSSISMLANAPHPNAGKLFVNFLLTKEGQKALTDWGRTPIRSDVESKYRKLLGKYKTTIVDIGIGEREKEINALIKKYFR